MWHEDDLVGRLLAEQERGGDEWTILHHPAINDAGEALWPEHFPIDVLRRIQRNVGPRAWQALYQGDPTPDEGVYFERKWLQRGVPPAKETMKIYGASDYAVTDDGGDYTVHLVVGIDPSERMWVLDLWRKQTSPDKWMPPLLDMMEFWKPIRWAEEAGQIEKSVGPFLFKECKCGVRFTAIACSSQAPPTSRREREPSRAVLPCAACGCLLPRPGPTMRKARLLKFPTGRHDDIVDTLSLIGRMIAGIEQGKELQPDEALPPGKITLNKLLELEESRRWR